MAIEYAVNNCGADWIANTGKKAESLLRFSSYSKSSLYEMLLFEGFTEQEAERGVSAVGY